MSELSGTLDGVGLPAIVRFLGGLNKTGCLRLSQQDWQAEAYFENGQVRHASLGTRTGVSALDAMVEALPRASFGFDSQAVRDGEPTITLSHDELLAHLDEVAQRVANGGGLPPPEAIPTQANTEGATEEQLSLDRGTLQTLLVVDGRRSVRQIVERRGMDALWHLARLTDLGLIRLETPTAAEAVAAPLVDAPAPLVEAAAPVVDAPEQPKPETHCPKLGFEDDPSSSFGRPTRLHRCFASATPLPLSLDQQRELCLSDQFATCPRLTTGVPPSTARPARPSPAAEDEPRIVRLPLRPLNLPSIDADQATRPPTVSAPTPLLRARLDRAATAATVAAAATVASVRLPDPERKPEEPKESTVVAAPDRAGDAVTPPGMPDERRIGPLPVAAIPVLVVVAVVVAVIAYLLLSQTDSLPGDSSLDTADLPNTGLVAAGTPVSDLDLRQTTPAAPQATPGGDAAQAAAAPAAQATPAASSGFTAVTDDTPAATPGATPGVVAGVRAPLFDEHFTTNDANWPNDPRGAALVSNGTYRIGTRQAGQFAAISAPVANVPADLMVIATFKKLAGPPGGGYGIIVRDQDSGVRDGTSQDGHYYVLEAGDKGEVGIWRRDGDHWVDLLPWQHSDAVQTGTATNELGVRAVGSSLSLSVNGTPVGTRTDPTFTNGQVGLFVGGDGNQVGVTRFTIQTP